MIKRAKTDITTLLSLAIVLLFVGTIFTQCANIGSPTGGPRDSLAPVIVAMVPENYSTNTDTMLQKIYIEFDEFVNVADQQKNFYTSPRMKFTPQLTLRGRGVVVTLRDTLKDNTTYSLNFGGAIRDVNEANPLNSMRYVFSTGDQIDSMIVSGYTEDSYKADSAGLTLLYFYPADSIDHHADYDSTLFNVEPSAIARSEKNGIFIAQNLKPIDYKVYGMVDVNNNFTYEPATDKVGFIDGVVNPTQLGDFSIWFDTVRRYVVADPQIHMRIFTDVAFRRQLLSESTRPMQHKAMLYFGANHPRIDSIRFDSIPSDKVMVEYMTRGKDTLSLWFDMPSELLPDTIRGDIYYHKHDSIRELTPVKEQLRLAWRYIESKKERQDREKLEKEREKAEENGKEWVEPEVPNPFVMSRSAGEGHNPEQSLAWEFQYPLRTIDTAAISITRMSADEAEKAREIEASAQQDSTIVVADIYRGVNQPFTIKRDTQNIRRYYVDVEWSDEESDEYYISLPKGTFTNIIGESNDSITQSVTLLKMTDYATVIVNVKADVDDKSNYILELVDMAGAQSVIESKEGINSGRVVFNYVPVGDMSLRLLQDRNNNGIWDTGNLVERRQPELSKIYQTNGDPKITTKANWEIELDVDATALFAPETPTQLAERLAKQERERIAEVEYKRQLATSLGN